MLFLPRAAVALAVALLLGAAGADAFELSRVGGDPCKRSDPNVSWTARETSISFESLDAVDAPLAREEAQAWNASTPFTFVEKPQSGFCDGGDDVVSTGFSTTMCDGTTFGENVLAVTLYRFNGATGAMVTAEIVFNSDAQELTEEATFRHVALHEMGHVLGLAHSDSCGGSGDNSVMKAVLRSTDPRRRVPGSDDIAGADFIYAERTATPTPTATPTGPTPTPRPPTSDGGCTARPGAGSGAIAIFAALVLMQRRARHLRRLLPFGGKAPHRRCAAESL